MHAIEVLNLSKKFGKKLVVDSLTFKVEKGIIFGLLGPNGAGKTTTLRMLCGLLKHNTGEIRIFGKKLKSPKELSEIIGVVHQHTGFHDLLTPKEYLSFEARKYFSKKVSDEDIHRLLKLSGLEEYENEHMKNLSEGTRRKVVIAKALLNEPRLLFLDEPTVGLDPQTRRDIHNYLFKKNKEGVTIMLTTHYIEEADTLCNEVAIMYEGKIVVQGKPSQLKATAAKNLEVEHQNVSLQDVFLYWTTKNRAKPA